MKSPSPNKAIPCHIIAGPLGTGKTTAILHYLKKVKETEYVAVLVNDFGSNGIDGIILENGQPSEASSNMEILSVPGGCLCCTSSIYLASALKELSQKPGIDRILIEPSGLVMLNQIKPLLKDCCKDNPLEVGATIVLLNPEQFDPVKFSTMPYWQSLADEADILIANRCDQASEQKIQQFLHWAAQLSPPKQKVLKAHYGQFPPEIINTEKQINLDLMQAKNPRRHLEALDSGSKTIPETTRFDFEVLFSELDHWAKDTTATPIKRLKGIFNTSKGWQLIEIAQGGTTARAFPQQATSQVDWIIAQSDVELFETQFSEILSKSAQPERTLL